jgi:hypothetical protein
MARPGALAMLAIGLVGCDTPAPADSAPGGPETQTISASGYGPIEIGMSIGSAMTALGEVELAPILRFDDPAPCVLYHLPTGENGEGLIVMVLNGRISRISDYDQVDAETPEGVKLGDTSEAVRAAYPGAIERPAKYEAAPAHDLIVWTRPEESGLRFEINAEGAAQALHAGDSTILLAEGCL